MNYFKDDNNALFTLQIVLEDDSITDKNKIYKMFKK